jgi:hypothetical protein
LLDVHKLEEAGNPSSSCMAIIPETSIYNLLIFPKSCPPNEKLEIKSSVIANILVT